jgi:hypothetical protein
MKKNILIAITIFALLFLFIPLVKAGDYVLEIDYPTIGGQNPSTNLVQYIRYIYLFALSVVGMAAFGALVYGGFQYLLSAGSMSSAEEAKKWIWGAIYGLVLALAAVLILRTINPDLINFEGPKPTPIQAPQTATPAVGAWLLRNDCMDLSAGTACYGDSYCTDPKPTDGADYCCCK